MMSVADPVAIHIETLRIDSGCSLEKEFTELIPMIPLKLLYITMNPYEFLEFNEVYSCHKCACGPLT